MRNTKYILSIVELVSIGSLCSLEASAHPTVTLHLLQKGDEVELQRSSPNFGPGNRRFDAQQQGAVEAFQERGVSFPVEEMFTLKDPQKHYVNNDFQAHGYYSYASVRLALSVGYTDRDANDGEVKYRGIMKRYDLKRTNEKSFFDISLKDLSQEEWNKTSHMEMNVTASEYRAPGAGTGRSVSLTNAIIAGDDFRPFTSVNNSDDHHFFGRMDYTGTNLQLIDVGYYETVVKFYQQDSGNELRKGK